MRYDSGMLHMKLAIICLAFVLCLDVLAAQRSSALLFAADATSDASTAAREAASQTGGRVLDVKERLREGTPVYDVKVLLDDGRVKVIELEGKSGAAQDRNGE